MFMSVNAVRRVQFAVIVVLGMALWAAPAQAQELGLGIRAGVSGDPDQFHFGAHVETPPLADQLTFRPNLEVGLGDDLTVITANFEFVYGIPLDNHPWRVYAGGGPALVLVNFDEDIPGDDSDAGGGLNFLVGLEHTGGLFFEFKAGVLDSPDVKFTVGYTFR